MFQLSNKNINFETSRIRYEWLSCMYFCLPKIILAMYIKLLTEIILQSFQNIVGMRKQITIRILYYVSYESLILLFLLFVSNSLIFYFGYFLFSWKLCCCSNHHHFWLGFCNHCNSACFLRCNNFERSSSNHDLRCSKS